MDDLNPKRDIAVSMRFREDDLDLIDRGAALGGVSRTEFVRRAALREAQLAVLNEAVTRLSPDAFEHFMVAIDAPPSPAPKKLRERLSRKATWEHA